ncbi:MAG: response regulator transcription factor [Bacteroidia bacterium]
MIRILIAEDHEVYAETLTWILQDQPSIAFLGHARNGSEALKMINDLMPDVVLMDLRMPLLGGAEATLRLKKLFPQVKVIFLSMVLGDETLRTLKKCGADGYLIKNTSKKELMTALRIVADGGQYYSQDVTQLVQERISSQNAEDYQPLERRGVFLTQKEQQVLKLFGAGLAPLEIARLIGFSLFIIESYIRNLTQKLSFREPGELQLYAQRVI